VLFHHLSCWFRRYCAAFDDWLAFIRIKTFRERWSGPVPIRASVGIKVNFLTGYGNRSKWANIGVQVREIVGVKAVKHFRNARAIE
jgi:hypothetical protein